MHENRQICLVYACICMLKWIKCIIFNAHNCTWDYLFYYCHFRTFQTMQNGPHKINVISVWTIFLGSFFLWMEFSLRVRLLLLSPVVCFNHMYNLVFCVHRVKMQGKFFGWFWAECVQIFFYKLLFK